MNISDLTKNYQKKNIPDIRVGDTVRISFKINEGGKTRIQVFEGLVITQKHGRGLDGTIKIRKISDGIGVERTFPLHSPLIVKFEKIKSTSPHRAKLYFIRDISARARRRGTEKKESGLWEEVLGEEELAKIEAEKAAAAEKKKKAKEEKKNELEEKFQKASAAHKKVEEEK